MNLLVFRSQHSVADGKQDEDYAQRFDTAYADRVIGNLSGDDTFCSACGPECIRCRKPYDRRFGEHIAGVIEFPAVLPYMIERPEEYLPENVPAHDVLIAIHIHEQILLAALEQCKTWGTRAVIVPLEASNWLSGATREEADRICEENGIEIAFPKPFCNLNPTEGSLLAKFREFFHIGYPSVNLTVENETIKRADVRVSAPCGATYFIARWLVGKTLDDDLKYDVVSRRLHSYPCTASMAWDDELGDTVLHVSGQAHYRILAPLGKDVEAEPKTVVTPFGRTVPKPIPPAENVANVEKAQRFILKEVETTGSASLKALRRHKDLAPAALHTALLLLRKAGRIQIVGDTITRA